MFDEGPPDNEDLQWDLHQAKAEIERLQKENTRLRIQKLDTKNEIGPDNERSPDAAKLEALRCKVNPEISRLNVIIGQALETFPAPWVFAGGRHLLVDCASSGGHVEVAVLSKDDDCEKEMQALRRLICEIPSHLFKTALALRRVLIKLRNDVDPEVPSGCWASSVQALEIILSELKPNDEPAAPLPGA